MLAQAAACQDLLLELKILRGELLQEGYKDTLLYGEAGRHMQHAGRHVKLCTRVMQGGVA